MKNLLAVLICLVPATSYAFDSITHEAITYSAFRHLETHAHLSPATDRWTSSIGRDRRFLEDLLARATVDADYHNDIWADGRFHLPFTGASNGQESSQFTTLMHYVNVTAPGRYWDYDGYSYLRSSRNGIDSYLNFPSLVPRGDLSVPLGGENTGYPAHGIGPGAMRLGFRGSDEEWRELYDRNTPMGQVVFPPADVVAQTNFEAMLRSERSASSFTESWEETNPLVSGVFSTLHRRRHYWRGQIAGLPEGLDLLGTAFHMAQDISVPQHAQGTADNCHQELESLADRLTCGTSTDPDMSAYFDGSFGSEPPDCQHLYDPELVERIRAEVHELDPGTPLSVRERIQAVARQSARWTWGTLHDGSSTMATRLPDGKVLIGDSCGELMKNEAVHRQLSYHYNLAVAITLTLFEDAALRFEDMHALSFLEPSNRYDQ